jgi:hypothetical protein
MTVRAKFNVTEVSKFSHGGGKVTLAPVYGTSEENKKFWKATPSGKIEMWIDNKEALDLFDFGEYYVDFTKAE